jgi:DNA gyrase subunit A
MPLRRLAALERRKIKDEYEEKGKEIGYLTSLLEDPAGIRGRIREELLTVKEEYGDPRRTEVVGSEAEIVSAEDLIPDLPVWVAVTRDGRVARLDDEGKAPRVPSRVKEPPLALLGASTQDTLYLFAADGEAVAYPVHQLPEGVAWEGEGDHVADLTALTRRQKVVDALVLPSSLSGYIFLTTRGGGVKRVALEDLPGVSGESFPAMGVSEDDELGWVALTEGDDQVVLVTYAGQAICFEETEVRSMGLPAGGVRGVKLDDDKDRVVGIVVVQARSDLFVAAEDGMAKRTPLAEFPTQGRYGKGVVAAHVGTPGMGLAGAGVVQSRDSVVLVTAKGKAKTIRAGYAPRQGRATQGDSVISLRRGDRVSDVFCPMPRPASEAA